jgi:DNA-binding transcriptional MerR regulator/copper chaperone CopZ
MADTRATPAKRLTIGELARQTGVGVETVRFYESEGLLVKPEKPLGSIRTYPQEAIDRLSFVHQAKNIGFTLREIRDLIALRDDPDADAAAVRGRTMAKLADVEEKVEQLERMRATLRDLLSHCPGRGDLGSCPIMQALSVTKASEPKTERGKGKHEVKSADLTIQGMHCDGCAKTVEALLKSEPGVKSATISYARGLARVVFDPAAVDLSALVKAVERAGYRVPETR